RIRRIEVCYDRIDLPAHGFLRFGWGIHHYPYREQVVHLFEWDVLTSHFIPDGIYRFGPAGNVKLESLPLKFFFDGLDKYPHQLGAGRLRRVDFLGYIRIDLEVGKPQIQVFQLGLDRIESERVGQRRIEIYGLRSDLELLVARHALQRPHIMEAVRQLDENYADVVGQCKEHLAEILRLLRRAVFKHAPYLGEVVDDARHFVAEYPFNVLQLTVGILHNVVEYCRNNECSA